MGIGKVNFGAEESGASEGILVGAKFDFTWEHQVLGNDIGTACI
jgi:hypothetical protein